MQLITGSSTCEDGKKACTQFFVKTSFDLIMPTTRSNENLQRAWLPIKFFIFKNFILYACFTFAFRLLLADPDPGPRDLDSCNLILLIESNLHTESQNVGMGALSFRFIGASFSGVQQHFETKVVDR